MTQPFGPAGSAPEVPGAAAGDCAAFFDVDNTMMMGASIFHFAQGVWRPAASSTCRDLVALRMAARCAFDCVGETHGEPGRYG